MNTQLLTTHTSPIFSGMNWPDAHPEELALLETCLQQPHDVAPRLIYSDWLEEHDLPIVADFIRIECGLYVRDQLTPERQADSLAASIAYWTPKFQHEHFKCVITAKPPLVRETKNGELAKTAWRSFHHGLPTKTRFYMDSMVELIRNGLAHYILGFTTLYKATTRPMVFNGVFGMMYQDYQLNKSEYFLNEHIHQLPSADTLHWLILRSRTNVNLPHNRPKLPIPQEDIEHEKRFRHGSEPE